MSIDVAALKAQRDIVSVVGSYLGLRKRGAEFVGLCPFHADTNPSFFVSPVKQIAHCFVCDETHDVISFVQAVEETGFKEACEKLGAREDWTPREAIPHEPAPKLPDRVTSKPPQDSLPDSFELRSLGVPESVYTIRDAAGDVLGYECRYMVNGKKEPRIWSWGARGDEAPKWLIGQFSPPRPLYGLERLADTSKRVAIFEGPKKADAGARMLPTNASISWLGGANAWHKHDWAPIAGRAVTIFPDADDPGWTAAEKLAAYLADQKGLACSVRIIDTRGMPEGWDIADAEADGWDTGQLMEWARPRMSDFRQSVPGASGAVSSDSGAPEVLAPAEAAVTRPERARTRPARGLSVVSGGAAAQEAPEAAPAPIPMSEDAIADAFAEEIGENWRYVAAWGSWMHWDGDGWRRDQKELIDRLAVEMCRRACTWSEAASLTPDQKRKISQRRTAGAVRDLARTDRRVSCGPDGWDADPLLIGIPGGVFDVRTGSVVLGRREQYITRCTSVAPESGEPTRWLEHLDRMMAGDREMIDFLQAYAGYSATGDVSEQCFLFLYGMGQTGKGTFLLTIGELLGSYAAQSSASTFMSSDRDKHSSEIARLASCRLVVIDETDGTARWNEERIKRMTGGGKITAARKFHDEEDIPVTWKLAFAGNHKPALRGVGKEMERRIRLVKCQASIPDESVDRRFRERMIAEEGPQIMNWILEGAMRWRESGLPLPGSVSAATRDYLQSEDVIGDWIGECCDQSGSVDRPGAYRNFSAWLEKRGDRGWSNRAWWAAMEDRGFISKKSNGVVLVDGLSLKLGSDPESGYWSGN